MKFICLFIFTLLIFKTNSNEFTFSSTLQAHMTFKAHTKTLFNELYSIANGDQKLVPTVNKNFLSEESFKILTYDQIKESLNKLATDHKDYVQVTTGQKRYGLPYPGGECGPGYIFNNLGLNANILLSFYPTIILIRNTNTKYLFNNLDIYQR
jgi:hypothetical protein